MRIIAGDHRFLLCLVSVKSVKHCWYQSPLINKAPLCKVLAVKGIIFLMMMWGSMSSDVVLTYQKQTCVCVCMREVFISFFVCVFVCMQIFSFHLVLTEIESYFHNTDRFITSTYTRHLLSFWLMRHK